MLNQLGFEDFSRYVHDTFILEMGDGDAVELELAEVAKLGRAPAEGDTWRQAFSVIFYGPDAPMLSQQIYTVTHAGALGTLALFLVPVGPDSTGRLRYEAVFT